MLADQLGIRLILLIGKNNPAPAPAAIMSAFRELTVTSDDETGDGFQMTFSMNLGLDLDFDLLKAGSLESFNRVGIAVQVGTVTRFLMDGVITHHQINSGDESGAKLVVSGKDVSVLLDYAQKNKSYPGQSDSVIVKAILADYAGHGIKPEVTERKDTPNATERIPSQHETDLAFIRRLAKRNGYDFYIEPKKSGVSTAYWGPRKQTGEPQKTLTANMIASTNVESLSFTFDPLAPVKVKGKNVETEKGEAADIAPASSLNTPPLSSSPTEAKRETLLTDKAKRNAGNAATAAEAAVTNARDPVRGQGTLNTLRYGAPLCARESVDVRGAGKMFDGTYQVRKVTHAITKDSYKQTFEISREGTGALSQKVTT